MATTWLSKAEGVIAQTMCTTPPPPPQVPQCCRNLGEQLPHYPESYAHVTTMITCQLETCQLETL